MASYTIKRGDTFAPTCQVLDGTTPRDITGWAIASQVRTPQGRLVATLTAGSRVDATGTYRLTAAGSTQAWPSTALAGPLQWDIQYTDGAGTVISTETIALNVVEDITR